MATAFGLWNCFCRPKTIHQLEENNFIQMLIFQAFYIKLYIARETA